MLIRKLISVVIRHRMHYNSDSNIIPHIIVLIFAQKKISGNPPVLIAPEFPASVYRTEIVKTGTKDVRSLVPVLQLLRYFILLTSSAVAASVTDKFHRAFPAVVTVMLHIQSFFRHRKAPTVDKLKFHRFALIIHS